MEERLKRRLVGAVVLVSLAVIFLPMLVEREQLGEPHIESSNIPPQPVELQRFKSSVLPLPMEEPLMPALEDEPLSAVAVPAEPRREDAEAPDDAERPRTGLSAWVVQVASLSSREAADKLERRLRDKGHTAFVEPVSINGKDLYRVRVGPELDRKRAEQAAEAILKSVDLKGQVVRYP